MLEVPPGKEFAMTYCSVEFSLFGGYSLGLLVAKVASAYGASGMPF